MFSRLTSNRFEKEKDPSVIGPGSYELPTTLDEHGHVISALGRSNLNTTETPGPGFYTEANDEQVLARTPSKKKFTSLQPSMKENRACTPNRQENRACTPNRRDEVKKEPPQKKSAISEVEQLKKQLTNEERLRAQAEKQLTNEERLRAQAESKVTELSDAKKWAAEAKAQLQSKERRLEDLQKQIEELNAKDSETQQKLRELRTEDVGKKKSLQEKDSTVTSLQKSLDQTKSLNQKLKEHLEKAEADLQPTKIEARDSRDALKESSARISELEEIVGKQQDRQKELQEQLVKVEAEPRPTKDEVRDSKGALKTASVRISELEEVLGKQQDRQKELEKLKEEASASVSEVQAKLEAANALAKTNQEKAVAKEAEAIDNLVQVESLKTAQAEAEKAAQVSAAKISELEMQLKDQQETVEETHRAVVAELEAKLEAANVLAKSHEERAVENESQVAEARAEIERLRIAQAEADKTMQTSAGRISELEVRLHEQDSANEIGAKAFELQLQEQRENAEEEMAKLRSAAESANVLAKAQEERAIENESQVTEARAEIERLEIAQADTVKSMETSAGRISELEVQLLEQRAANEKDTKDLEQRLQEQRQNAEDEIAKVRSAVEAANVLAKAHEDKAAENEIALIAARETSDASLARIAELEQSAEQFKNTDIELQKARAAAESDAKTVGELEAKIAQQNEATDASNVLLASKEEKISVLLARVAELQEQIGIAESSAKKSSDNELALSEKLLTVEEERDRNVIALQAKEEDLKESRAHAVQLQQRAEKMASQREQERHQQAQALADERAEKEALQAQNTQLTNDAMEEAEKLKELLERQGGGEEIEELRDRIHNTELQCTALMVQADESKTALDESQTRLEECRKIEANLKQEALAAQNEDRRIRKEEKTRLSEVQENANKLKADLEKLQFAEKRSQMYKSAKEKADQEVKDLKMELEHFKQKTVNLEVDSERLRNLEEHAAARDSEAEEVRAQNAQLLMSMKAFELEYELTIAENRSLQETLAEFEADLEQTKDDNAKLTGHTNHKQKVKYHIKVKEENQQLKQDLAKARQRLTQLEVSHKGTNFADTLAAWSAVGPEASVCSTTPGHGLEPRTPDPKARKSEATIGQNSVARTPRRPNSRSAQVRGQVDPCQQCAMQERAIDRLRVDFQHFCTLIDRVVYEGEGSSSNGNPDPMLLLEKLRDVVSRGARSSNTIAQQTPKATRAACQDDQTSP